MLSGKKGFLKTDGRDWRTAFSGYHQFLTSLVRLIGQFDPVQFSKFFRGSSDLIFKELLLFAHGFFW
jgi:hypothetical protein